MTRLRIVFVSLALLLAIGVAVLVSRVVASVEGDRLARRHSVADRVFDEMERALSSFLRDEEAREVAAYARVAELGEGAPAFVWGHFEIDSQGRMRASDARVRELVARIWTRVPSPALGARDELADADERASGAGTAAGEAAFGVDPVAPTAGPAELAQAPGTTLVFDEGPDPAKAKHERVSPAYEAFQSLNRGASQREERARKVVVAEARPDEQAAAGTASAPAPARDDRAESASAPSPRSAAEIVAEALEADLVEREERASPTPSVPGPERARRPGAAAPARPPDTMARRPGGVDPEAAPRDGRTGAVIIDPMVGRLEGGAIVLSRTVWDGSAHRRQGLVVDPAALGAFLEHQTLGALEGARARFAAPAEASPGAGADYRHRFAEPFDALVVDLALPPLPESAGERALPWLAIGVALAAALGLFAAYRMVAAEWAYAERRGNFVSAVSHELKTPLTAIRMYAEMLRDGLVPGDAKRQEYYGAITSESERLSRLIDNVLEFSRLEKGTREPDLRVGSVGPVVREAADLLRPHVEGLGGRLALEIEDGLPSVRFDRDALVQVLFNLVDNAAKYAHAAEDPTLHLRARAVPAGVEISVRDHGPGVASEHLPHLLESFYRVEDELTRTTKGAGIGLALVRGLCEQMGARLALGNADGGGFEVRLALPAA